MDLGTILILIVGGFLLLVVLFLPLITRSSTKAELNNNEEREKAHRLGLMIGSLMQERLNRRRSLVNVLLLLILVLVAGGTLGCSESAPTTQANGNVTATAQARNNPHCWCSDQWKPCW
jgi:hypothetical protein